jgi:hypothetical protein
MYGSYVVEVEYFKKHTLKNTHTHKYKKKKKKLKNEKKNANPHPRAVRGHFLSIFDY